MTAGDGPSWGSRHFTRTAITSTSSPSTWRISAAGSRSSSPSTATRWHIRAAGVCQPGRFTVIEGLLGYYLPEMLDIYDVRVYLNPPEDLRRRWKVQRDCSRRGYTTDQVLAELDRREPDSEAFIRPQRRKADMLIRFSPGRPPGSGAPGRRADAPRRSPPSGSDALHAGSRGRIDLARAQRRAPALHPRTDEPGSRGRHRGGDLGTDALRDAPAGAASRRVHRGDRAVSVRIAGAGATADPLSPRHGAAAIALGPTGCAAQIAR